MASKYIISFVPGSSGRFIAHTLWGMLKRTSEQLQLTRFNSAHYNSPWRDNWDNEFTIDEHNPSVWDSFSCKDSIVVIPTHQFPDFKKISAGFNDYKIILITLDYYTFKIVYSNSFFKNGFDLNPATGIKSETYARISKTYSKLYNTELDLVDPTELDQKTINQLYISEHRTTFSVRYKEAYEWVSPAIPDEFLEKTLMLPYSNILNGTALELLSAFTCLNIDSNTKINYDAYLKNQHRLIQEKMAWINKTQYRSILPSAML